MQKRQSVSQRFTYWLKVVSLGMVLGLGIQFAEGWVAPTQAPPGGNVAGPLTTGLTAQTKQGSIWTNIGLRSDFDSYLAAVGGNVGIGTTAPTQRLDVNGKIRMAIQTVATDANDIVATKGYVDGKVTAGSPGNVKGGCGPSNNVADSLCGTPATCWGGAAYPSTCPLGSTLRRTGAYTTIDCGGDGLWHQDGAMAFICVQN